MKSKIVLLILFAFLMSNCNQKVKGCRHMKGYRQDVRRGLAK